MRTLTKPKRWMVGMEAHRATSALYIGRVQSVEDCTTDGGCSSLWPNHCAVLGCPCGVREATTGIPRRHKAKCFQKIFAQFLALCSRSKWSKHFTNALIGFQGLRPTVCHSNDSANMPLYQ